MASSILQELLECVVSEILGWLCFQVGRVSIALLSFGRWRTDNFKTRVARRTRKWGGIYHVQKGEVYVTAGAVQLLGLIVMVVAIVALITWKGSEG